jgi:DNA (cytosine-5)-methyltransferase 1
MTAFYNEHDPLAAAWLRELIRLGHIAPGVVDERNIQQLREVDLGGFTQVHLFAGIGGWSLALRLAGWPDDRPVWTGSCPCQPFSSAGKQKGAKDARHLWPWMRHLVFRWRPAISFGEQVASGLGRQWLAGVRANLETLGYAVGAADLCAAGVAAPHIRQRLWWFADNGESRCSATTITDGLPREWDRTSPRRPLAGGRSPECSERESCRMGNPPRRRNGPLPVGRSDRESEAEGRIGGVRGSGASGWLVNPLLPRLEGHAGQGDHGDEPGRVAAGAAGSVAAAGAVGGVDDADGQRRAERTQRDGGTIEPQWHAPRRPDAVRPGGDFWSAFDLIPCRDGKARRVEPGTFPLAHGVSGRVGKLRGYGNAISPPIAAAFVTAYLETRTEVAPC